jgi:peptide/nickel transport system substrate-binding protein
LGLVGQPQTLNPILENNPALREIRPLLFETLLRVDPTTAELKPGLAQAWEFSEDGQQVIFHLPANLKWSDGRALTGAGIAASLEATKNPALQAFSDIQAIDDETLRLTFAAINCSAVTTLAQLPLIPSEQITATVPVGSGPFMVADWPENKRSLQLRRNPNYQSLLPTIDTLTIRLLRESDIQIALSEGQFDAIGSLQAPLGPYQLPPGLADLSYSGGQMVYLAINFAPKNGEPLDPKLREALLLALDRETILSQTLDGDGQLLTGPLPLNHWATVPTLPSPEYNPETARKLLIEAGLQDQDGDGWLEQDGQRLDLAIRVNGRNPLQQNLGWLLSSYYRSMGLFTRAEGVGFDSVVDDLFTHDFNLAIFSWPLRPDPDQRLYWHSAENVEGFGLNFTSYNNPRLDRLLDQANAVPGCETQERAKIYAEIQEILSQDRPVDFLVVPNNHLFLADRLRGLSPGPFAPFTWNAAEWFMQKE